MLVWLISPSWVFKNLEIIFADGVLQRVETHHHLPKSANPLQRYREFFIFPICRPSAILDLLCGYARVWTTYEEHLAVFIITQNLVGIDAVVSIICIFYFVSLAWKCLFTPPKLFLGIFDPLNGSHINKTPKGTFLCESASFEPSCAKIRGRI